VGRVAVRQHPGVETPGYCQVAGGAAIGTHFQHFDFPYVIGPVVRLYTL